MKICNWNTDLDILIGMKVQVYKEKFACSIKLNGRVKIILTPLLRFKIWDLLKTELLNLANSAEMRCIIWKLSSLCMDGYGDVQGSK